MTLEYLEVLPQFLNLRLSKKIIEDFDFYPIPHKSFLKEIVYVEGFMVCSPYNINFDHAWLQGKHGEIIDPTYIHLGEDEQAQLANRVYTRNEVAYFSSVDQFPMLDYPKAGAGHSRLAYASAWAASIQDAFGINAGEEVYPPVLEAIRDLLILIEKRGGFALPLKPPNIHDWGSSYLWG